MVNLKRKRAWHAISQMDGEWIDIKELAAQAGLTPIEMSRYLREAKVLGLVEYRKVGRWKNGACKTVSLWRFRLNSKPLCPRCGHVLAPLGDDVFECVVCGVGWKPVSRPFSCGEGGPNQSASKRGEKRRK
ncbi:MAG TPA: hypothetical protein ENF90_00720 [Candidatus Bathyarchaeota archaeon]|nr:hypothetical protein [Candidatus Bathyarchaeota archaeon]